jgi:hypothetical protein
MLFATKWVYAKKFPFMMKMHVKSAKSDVVLKNWSVLCDVEFILGLPCMLN